MRSEDVLDQVQAGTLEGDQPATWSRPSLRKLLHRRVLNVSDVRFSGIRGNMSRLMIACGSHATLVLCQL